MVAALVLSLVGVDDDVIVEDYALTDDRMVFVMESDPGVGRRDPAAARDRRERRPRRGVVDGDASCRGSPTGTAVPDGWADAAGLDDDTLASLARRARRRPLIRIHVPGRLDVDREFTGDRYAHSRVGRTWWW